MIITEKYIAFLPFIAGVSVLIYFFKILYFYKVTIKRWHSVEGIIIGNEVDYQNSTSISEGGWVNKVEYTFTFNNIIYTSTNISNNIKRLQSFREDVEINEIYASGKAVKVFYNPNNPLKSVIGSNFSLYNLSYLLFGFIAFWIAYVIWY